MKTDDEIIRKTIESNDKMENDLAELNARQQELNEQIKAKQEELGSEQEQPVRILKQNESTSQGVATLEDELKKKQEAKKKLEYEVRVLNENIEKIEVKAE